MERSGQGGPLSIPDGLEWPDALVFEALARHVPPHLIDAALQRTGRHSRRVRKLPASAVVWLVIAIGLFGELDTAALWRQVSGTLAALLRVLANRPPPGKSALSQARTRLGARPLRQLFRVTAGSIATAQTRGATYKGMAMKAMDGQDYSLPDTPGNARAFGKRFTKRNGKTVSAGYPQIHVNRLIEVGTRMTIEALIKPQDHNDHPTAAALLKRCDAGDLVLWDCGFYSYRLIKQAQDQGTFMLGPVASHVVLDKLAALGDGSYLARIYPNRHDRLHQRNGVIVRVIEYTFDDPARIGHGEVHRLVTTLLDAEQYPARELVVLYHQRWEIEIANDEITTHQLARPVELRSKTPCGVVQEMYGILLAHNAIRALMHESALRVEVDPRTLSFTHALRVVRETIPLLRAARTQQLPRLYDALIQHIATGHLPPRDNRINPRVVKVKMSNFPKKRAEDYHVQQPTRPFEVSIVMLN